MFYVYVYKDPRPSNNRRVVYVGKGTGDRAWQHWRKAVHKNKGFGNFLALLRRDSLEPIIELVQENLSEAEAFVEEMRLIALYGRRDLKTGYLFNLTDGGEGFANIVRTEEWSKNISSSLSTEEHKSRQSISTLALWANPEWRAKTTQAIREALKDPEVIRRREEGKAAFIHTDEFRETMRGATIKLWQNDSYKEKVITAQKAVQGTEEARATKSIASIETWANPDIRNKRQSGIKRSRSSEISKAKTSSQAKAQWADPEYASKQTENNKEIANRPEVKAAKAAAAKAKWANPEWRAKMLEARKNKKEMASANA